MGLAPARRPHAPLSPAITLPTLVNHPAVASPPPRGRKNSGLFFAGPKHGPINGRINGQIAGRFNGQITAPRASVVMPHGGAEQDNETIVPAVVTLAARRGRAAAPPASRPSFDHSPGPLFDHEHMVKHSAGPWRGGTPTAAERGLEAADAALIFTFLQHL